MKTEATLIAERNPNSATAQLAAAADRGISTAALAAAIRRARPDDDDDDDDAAPTDDLAPIAKPKKKVTTNPKRVRAKDILFPKTQADQQEAIARAAGFSSLADMQSAHERLLRRR
jgi:hypothetical protein